MECGVSNFELLNGVADERVVFGVSEHGCRLAYDLFAHHRGREQVCACPPAQIPACALTHGVPASDDDERPLVGPRVLKPVAEPEKLRFEIGTESVSFTALLAVPSGRFRRPVGYCYPPVRTALVSPSAGPAALGR